MRFVVYIVCWDVCDASGVLLSCVCMCRLRPATWVWNKCSVLHMNVLSINVCMNVCMYVCGSVCLDNGGVYTNSSYRSWYSTVRLYSLIYDVVMD